MTKVCLFIGYVAGNNDLDTQLQTAGFICVFKPTVTYRDGKTKGNCDAELVLQAMTEYQYYKKVIIVTGDGDFYCLVKYLLEQEKLERVLVPNSKKYSALLKRFIKQITFMDDLRTKLAYKKKRTPQGRNPEGD